MPDLSINTESYGQAFWLLLVRKAEGASKTVVTLSAEQPALDVITIPFIPSVLARNVIRQEFAEKIRECGFIPGEVHVWTYTMPHSLAEGENNSFEWHIDYGNEMLAVWANVFVTEIRHRTTMAQVDVADNHIAIFSDQIYEHRTPPAIKSSVGIRWFARSYL